MSGDYISMTCTLPDEDRQTLREICERVRAKYRAKDAALAAGYARERAAAEARMQRVTTQQMEAELRSLRAAVNPGDEYADAAETVRAHHLRLARIAELERALEVTL